MSAPRVATVEVFPLALPLAKPMRLASETIATSESLVVRLRDTAGCEGWGEAAAAPTMTGDLLPGMVAAVRRFIAPALTGTSLEDPAVARRRIARAIRGNSGAKAAAEIALHDLLARARGIPLAATLGAARRRELPAILMLGGACLAATLAEAASGAARGFGYFKLKVGTGAGPEEDAEILQELRRRLGPSTHLSADANMAWTPEEAVRFLDGVRTCGLAYLEQPVADSDIAGMAAVAARSAIPLCVDEGLHGLADIDAHARLRAAGGFGLKAIKLGGIQGVLEADARCRRHGLKTTLACKIAESSIGAAATAHMAAVLPDADWGVSVTHQYLAEDVTESPVRIAGGAIALPEGPGLGLLPDPERLEAFRARLD